MLEQGSLGGDAVSGAIPDILSANAILPEAPATTARQVLRDLGTLAQRVYGLDAKSVAEALRQRESVASTGMCGGVAVPHAHLPDLGAPVGLFARLRQPVDFGASDGVGVDLVFALLSPTVPCAAHLRALARISRLLRTGDTRRKLRGTDDAPALYALLTDSAP
ncbi:MAG: PTS sugar transporter subunit IIA [Paracoccaceae bacterium]|nr:PTS sugar transporter subunit IIA [Paracoccaceae bacterium]